MKPKEGPTAVPIDYGDITSAAGRALWLAHWQRVEDDPGLDPRLRRWLQDPTLWTIADASQQCGYGGSQRVWILRAPNLDKRRPLPHPHRFVPDVESVGRVADRDQPGFAAGMVRQWARQRGTHVIDPDTGDLHAGLPTYNPDTGELELRDRRVAPHAD